MSEPMVSHDASRSTCSRRRSRAHRKVVQSGQGADEVFGGYYWYPPLLEADGDGAATSTRRTSSTATHAGVAALLRAAAATTTRRAAFVDAYFAGRAPHARSTAACGSTPR